jgi:hypothetical protein
MIFRAGQSHKLYGVTVAHVLDIAQSFFCFHARPLDPFCLDSQWICATNKLMNQFNRDLQHWRSQEPRLLGVVSPVTELNKALANCPDLSESQQIDFIDRGHTPDPASKLTAHIFQRMTLARLAIDCRSKFWEHGHFSVVLAQGNTSADTCILLPRDMDDFMIWPPLDRKVVRILQTLDSSSPLSTATSLPVARSIPSCFCRGLGRKVIRQTCVL